LRKLQLTCGGEKSADGGEATTVGGEMSSKWAKRPGGESSRGRNVLVVKRRRGETSINHKNHQKNDVKYSTCPAVC